MGSAFLLAIAAMFVQAGEQIGAAVQSLPGAVWADRNNDGYADGYVYNGAYYAGAPENPQASQTTRSYIGLGLQPVDADIAQAVGVPEGEIVRAVVPGQTGARAGVQVGDIIVAINARAVSKDATVSSMIAQIPVGSAVNIEVVRSGQRVTLIGHTSRRPSEHELAAMSASPATPAGNSSVQIMPTDFAAGLGLATINDRLASSFRLPAGTRGALLTDVQPGSAAHAVGLQRGDAIISVGNVATPDSASAKAAMEGAFSRTGSALLLVRRSSQPPAFLGLRGEASPTRVGDVAETLPAVNLSAPQPATLGTTGPRHALIIGNAQYGASLGRLPNPVNDARQVAAALQRVGFSVDLVIDADQKAMKRAISRFGDRLAAGGRSATGLFYYAGHGIQSRGTNYLIPVSAPIEREADLDLEGVAADTVLAQMEEAGAGTSIVILDACRNMPLARSFRSASRGLARMDAPNGSFIAYSTAPGSTAADGDGRNSPFAAALVKQLGQKGLPIEVMFRGIRRQVVEATGGQQTPWDSSSLLDPFYFVP